MSGSFTLPLDLKWFTTTVNSSLSAFDLKVCATGTRLPKAAEKAVYTVGSATAAWPTGVTLAGL